MKASKSTPETVAAIRDKLRRAVEESGLTQEDVGLRMGFASGSARRAVSRLLNADAGHDPRLSTLLSFAEALGKPLQKLL